MPDDLAQHEIEHDLLNLDQKISEVASRYAQSSGASGPSTFIGLSDTPSSFSGAALQAVRVNSGQDALEFYTPSGGETDEKVKISTNDTTAGYAEDKLVAGTNVTITKNNAGGNETLTISSDGGSSGVSSFNSRTGDVLPEANDYAWDDIDKTSSDIADIADRSHTDLQDIGTNTHAQIDSHIANTSNPHSVTAAQASAVALTGDETVAGVKTFSSIPVLPSSDPTSDNQAVRKAYVDAFAQGITGFDTVRASTTAALPAVTYNNGTSGVGATLTANSNGALAAQDGVTLLVNEHLLVKNQAAGLQNGLYTVTQVGNGGAPFILTRKTTSDTQAELDKGHVVTVLEGTTNSNSLWVQRTDTPTIGTDALEYAELPAPDPITASNGVKRVSDDFQIDLSDTNPSLEVSDGGLRAKVDDSTIERASGGLQIKDSGVAPAKLQTVTAAKGGTGLTSIGTANQVLGVNSGASALEYKSITAGSNVSVTHSAGGIQISSSLSGSADFSYSEVSFQSDASANFTWTNLPAAVTAGSSLLRKKVDLTGAAQFRLLVNQQTAGFAGSEIRLRYSLNNSTFFDLDADNSGDLDVGTGTGVKVGAWTDIVSGAKTDVWLQLYALNGDGIVDPTFRQMSVQIKYNSSLVDGSESSIAFREITVHSHPSSALAWTNMPAAETEFLGATTGRQKADLSGLTHYRIVVNQSVAGFAGADLNLEYSLNGSTFVDADTAAAGEIDVGTGTGIKYGAWASLAEAARGDVWLRLVGKHGDGIVDPAFRQVKIQFKGNITGPVAGSDTQVIYNDLGNAAGDSSFTFDQDTNTLTVENLKITGGTPGSGKLLQSDADGDASWQTVTIPTDLSAVPFITQAASGSTSAERVLTAGTGISLVDGGANSTMTVNNTITDLNDLTDVDLTTPPTNGQALVYSDEDTYQTTNSPLSWNGTNYDDAQFGASSPATYFILGPSGLQIIDADSDPLVFDTVGDVHVGLCDVDGTNSAFVTFFVIDGFLTGQGASEDGSGLQTVLRLFIDPGLEVDNFKADYFTNSSGTITHNGFSGFEQAGTVAVVGGFTTPPAITLVPGAAQWVPQSLQSQVHFGTGIYEDEGDTAQTVANNTEVNLNVDTDTLFEVDGWNTDGGSHTFAYNGDGGPISGGHGVVNVWDDSGEPIPSALIKVQFESQGDWYTVGAGVGSATFPIDVDGQNTQEIRIRMIHTEGSAVDVFARVDIYYTA